MKQSNRLLVILIISIFSANFILLLVLGVCLISGFGVLGDNDALSSEKHSWNGLLQGFQTENESKADTSEITTSFSEYIENHYDEYLAEKARLEETYMDLNKTYLPSDADFARIERGMPISEVMEIVGRPHGWSVPGNFGIWLHWTSDSGLEYTIIVDGSKPYHPAIDSIEETLSQGKASSIVLPDTDTGTLN